MLLDSRKEFHSFGNEAKKFFYDLDVKQSSKYYYFENFKMILYQNKVDNNLKIKSLNHQNTEISALKIFSLTLEYLCQQAMNEIGQQCSMILGKEDIGWVITVPAIWSDSSKQFMRLAAEQTKLIDGELLRIALEPEVASLYCKNFLTEEYRRIFYLDNNGNNNEPVFKFGKLKT